MNIRLTPLFVLFLVSCILPASGQSGSEKELLESLLKGYPNVHTSLMNLAPDPAKVAKISGLMMTRDVGTFFLEEGSLYLCKPVAGRLYAAVFIGKGSFQYAPPTWVEAGQLLHHMKKDRLYEEFNSLVFFCGDSALYNFQNDWVFEPGSVPDEVAERIEEALPYIGDEKSGVLEPEFALPLLNEEYVPFFYAHMEGKNIEPLFFEINPYESTGEEVRFMLREKELGNRYWKMVNQFHTAEEYSTGATSANDGRPMLSIDHCTIETRIPKGVEFSAVADISFSMLDPDTRWVNFSLYPELHVDSAFWEDGTRATAVDPADFNFWVKMRDGLQKVGDRGMLKVYYHGELIARRENWFALKSSIMWYPHHGFKGKATYDLTFHIPEDFRFVSIGKKVSEEKQGKMVVTRWVQDTPVRNVSFNLGFFDEHIVEVDDFPPIVVWIGRYGHGDIGLQQLAAAGITSGADMEKQVAQDVEGSIQLYQKLFGKYPADKIVVTEILQGHGEAFPGLIHISWSTFQRTDASGWDHRFRAHEVAHQWWGANGVDFKTYHDQWLSEGFADYSSLMYLQAVSEDKDAFFRTLREWKDDVLKVNDQGPIWLGYRLGRAYSTTVYEKGGWVLHMLRNMMIDLKTMKEDRFEAMMREFFETYSGKEATTEDFQAIAEKHMGRVDLTWFFQQWVYGIEIPTYRFEYDVKKGPDGKYIATINVEQKDVSPEFQMYVPITIDYGKNGTARFRVLISGSGGPVPLPPLSQEPKEIRFNEFESVLCRIE